MEIYPERQLLLFFYAFLSGILLGGFYEVLRAFRILLGVMPVPPRLFPLYERKLPLLGKGIPVREGRGKRVRRGIAVAVGDFLFMVVSALVAVLLLYDYNSGEFRVFVPILMAAGFGLFRISISRLCGFLTPYIAFGLAVAAAYFRALCLLPVRLVIQLARWTARPCRALYFLVRRLLLRKKMQALCRRQLEFAATGFGYPGSEVKKEGGHNVKIKTHRKRKADPVDQNSRGADLPFGTGHHRRAADRIQPQAKRSRGT